MCTSPLAFIILMSCLGPVADLGVRGVWAAKSPEVLVAICVLETDAQLYSSALLILFDLLSSENEKKKEIFGGY